MALATGMFVSNVVEAGWVPAHDPLLVISMPIVFWITGVVELAVGLVCLFGERASLKPPLILWLAMVFLTYQLGLFWTVGRRSFHGYWGNLADTFHFSPDAACWILMAAFVYLLIGSIVSLLSPCDP